jgi:hypothetical protein
VIAVAFVVAAASLFLVVRAFRGEPNGDRPDRVLPAGLDMQIGPPVPVGEYPNAVAIGEGAVWVSSSSADGDDLRLVRVDPVTGEVVARIPVPTVPTWEVGGGGLVASSGSIWVAGAQDTEGEPGCCGGVLLRIDPATNDVAEVIELGAGFGADVWIDETGIWVLLFGPERDDGSNIEVVRLDPITHEVVARVPLPSNWAKQVFGFGGSIWIHGNEGRGSVTNELVETVPLPSQEFPLAVDGVAIWQRTPDGVVRVDAAGSGISARLEGFEEFCCSHIASDGHGGVWTVSRLAEDRYRIAHVTPQGAIDRVGEVDVSPELTNAVTATLDPGRQTIWIVQYERTVTPLRLASG